MRHWFPGERRDLVDIPPPEMAAYAGLIDQLPPIGWTYLKIVTEPEPAEGG